MKAPREQLTTRRNTMTKSIADDLATSLEFLMVMVGGEPDKRDRGARRAWRKAEKALKRWRTNRTVTA